MEWGSFATMKWVFDTHSIESYNFRFWAVKKGYLGSGILSEKMRSRFLMYLCWYGHFIDVQGAQPKITRKDGQGML